MGTLVYSDGAINGGDSATASLVTSGITFTDGQLILVVLSMNGSVSQRAAINGLTLKTRVDMIVEPTLTREIWWKISDGTEPSPYEWTLPASGRWGVAMLVFDPAGGEEINATLPFDVDPPLAEGFGTGAGTGNPQTADAILVGVNDAMGIAVGYLDSTGAVHDGFPADGYVQRQVNSGGQNISLCTKGALTTLDQIAVAFASSDTTTWGAEQFSLLPSSAPVIGSKGLSQIDSGIHDTGIITIDLSAPPPDPNPDAFGWPTNDGWQLNEVANSGAIVPTGYNVPSMVSVDIGDFSIQNDLFSATARPISPGQQLVVRHTTSGLNDTQTTQSVTIGTTVGTFTTETIGVAPPGGPGQILSTDFEPGIAQTKDRTLSEFLSAFQPCSQNGWDFYTGTSQPGQGAVYISDEMSKPPGGKSLAAMYTGSPDLSKDSFTEARYVLGALAPLTEIWFDYDLYIPANWETRKPTGSNNDKFLFRVWGGGLAAYDATVRDGPMLAVEIRGNGTVSNGIYPRSELSAMSTARINGVPDDVHHWNQSSSGRYYDPAPGRRFFIVDNDLGQWMHVTQHFKYATGTAASPNEDGVLETWKRDWEGALTKINDIQDGNWFGTVHNTTTPSPGFDTGYLHGWMNAGFNVETTVYIDNLLITTDDITPV